MADPKNPYPYYNIGLNLEKRGDYAGALGYFEKYLEIVVNPDKRSILHIEKFRKKLQKKK